jgi:tetratricopeptide (TPR) repeat protein
LLAYLAARPETPVPREELLREVWGYRAMKSRTVDTTVKTLRQKIEVDPTRPTHILTERGVGYRFRPLARIPSRTTTTLHGRQRELAELTAAIEAGHRLITVVGLPGMRKSALAEHWLAATGRAVRRVALSSASGRTGLVRAMAETLDLPVADRERICSALREVEPAWLWLDDAEGVLAALADVLPQWLDADVTQLCLVTSRAPLGIPGEHVVCLRPLSEDAGVAVFRSMGAATVEEARAIVRHLDGLPLAILLAAGQTRTTPAGDLLGLLDRQLDVLRTRRRELPQRHRSLRAALANTWHRLSVDIREGWMAASCFADRFTHRDLSAVLGRTAVLELEGLVDRALVEVDGGSLRVLSPVRAFGREQLTQPFWDRHAAWAVRTAAMGEHSERATPEDCARLVRLQEDLKQAATRSSDFEMRAQAVASLGHTLFDSGDVGEALALLDAVLDEPELSAERRAHALWRRGVMRAFRGDASGARADFVDGAAIASPTLAAHLEVSRVWLLERGQPGAREALEALQHRLERFGDAGSVTVILAKLAISQDRHEDALDLLGKALQVSATYPRLHMVTLVALGRLALARRRWQLAEDRLHAALVETRAHRDLRAGTKVLVDLGALAWHRGRRDEADRWYAQAEAQARRTSDDWSLAALARYRLLLALDEQRWGDAEAHALAAIAEAERLSLPELSWCRGLYGWLEVLRGEQELGVAMLRAERDSRAVVMAAVAEDRRDALPDTLFGRAMAAQWERADGPGGLVRQAHRWRAQRLLRTS